MKENKTMSDVKNNLDNALEALDEECEKESLDLDGFQAVDNDISEEDIEALLNSEDDDDDGFDWGDSDFEDWDEDDLNFGDDSDEEDDDDSTEDCINPAEIEDTIDDLLDENLAE